MDPPFSNPPFFSWPSPAGWVIARPSRDLGPRSRPKELSPIEAAREAAAKKGRHGGTAVPARRNSGTMAAMAFWWGYMGCMDLCRVIEFMIKK